MSIENKPVEKTESLLNVAPAEAEEALDDVNKSRREAILKMAKYTAPVMLGMLVSEKAMAHSSTWTPSG
jgi:hypothetical protein